MDVTTDGRATEPEKRGWRRRGEERGRGRGGAVCCLPSGAPPYNKKRKGASLRRERGKASRGEGGEAEIGKRRKGGVGKGREETKADTLIRVY